LAFIESEAKVKPIEKLDKLKLFLFFLYMFGAFLQFLVKLTVAAAQLWNDKFSQSTSSSVFDEISCAIVGAIKNNDKHRLR